MTVPYPTEARTLTFNKDNWSGEDATIEVQEGNRFQIYDYQFELVDETPKDQGDEKPGDKYFVRVLKLVGSGWERPLTTISWCDGDKITEKFTTFGEGHSRVGPDPVIAAARWVFMHV